MSLSTRYERQFPPPEGASRCPRCGLRHLISDRDGWAGCLACGLLVEAPAPPPGRRRLTA